MEYSRYLVSAVYKTSKKILYVESIEVVYEDFVTAAQLIFDIKGDFNFLNHHDIIIEPDIFIPYILQYLRNPDFIIKIEDERFPSIEYFEEVHSPLLKPILIPHDGNNSNDSLLQTFNQTLHQLPTMTDFPQSEDNYHIGNNSGNDDVFVKMTKNQSIATATDIRKIPELDIYLVQGFVLNNIARSTISKIIIRNFIGTQYEKRLTKENFVLLADLITQVWPGELTSSYYIPFKHKKLASGKLWDCYNNYRSKLKQHGLVERRIYSKGSAKKMNNERLSGKIQQTSNKQSDPLEYLRSYCSESDKNSYFSIWKSTYGVRKKILERIDKIEDYLNMFPFFNDPLGYELAYYDGEAATEKTHSISAWDKYYNKVMRTLKIKQMALQNKSLHELMERLTTNFEEDQKIFAMLLLPHLLLLSDRKRDSNGMQKAYNPLVHEPFIAFFKNMSLAHHFENSNTDQNINNHPRVVIIGNPIAATYLIVNNKKYWLDEPLKAVEACYMFYLSLDLSFPAECETSWNFLEKCVLDPRSSNNVLSAECRQLLKVFADESKIN